jgi:hypothetical protein
MKKVLSYILLLFLPFINNFSTYATNESKSGLIKSIIVSRNILKKNELLAGYVTLTDKLIYTIKDEEDKLRELESKVEDMKSRLNKSISSSKKNNLIYVLNYLKAKTKLSLLKFKDEVVNLSEGNNLSDSDIKIIENKLVDLQLNLFKK